MVLASKVPPPSTPTSFGTPGALTGLAAVGAVAVAAGGSGGGSGGSGGSSSGAATLSFAVSSTAVGECDSNITISANLTKAHSSNVTVTYTIGGTATLNTDYTLTATTSTITAGATSGSITLDPTNDTTVETSETVTLAATVTAGGVSTTGNTSTTITIHDYVLKCNATAFTVGTTSEQNTIKGRSSWTEVNGQSGTVHPYELVNLHKAHSFKSGSTTLTGNGQTVYVMDDAMHNNHDSFNGKTVTMLDTPSVSNSSVQHGTHVASTVAGVIGGTTHGVAPDASLVFSTFSDNGTNQAADIDTARATHSAIAMNNSWGYSDGWNGSVFTSSVTMGRIISFCKLKWT